MEIKIRINENLVIIIWEIKKGGKSKIACE